MVHGYGRTSLTHKTAFSKTIRTQHSGDESINKQHFICGYENDNYLIGYITKYHRIKIIRNTFYILHARKELGIKMTNIYVKNVFH